LRRTEQEFKAEILRREKAYRWRQKQRRNHLLGIAACLVLFMGGISMLIWPAGLGAASADAAPQEPEMLMDAEVPALEAPAADSNAECTSKYAGSGLIVVELSLEDMAVVSSYLDADWVESLADCSSDYLVVIGARELRYHSDCGTFQDYRSGHSLTVSEEARIQINRILENY